MPVNFAAERSVSCSPLTQVLSYRDHGKAANDNAAIAVDDQVMKAALRHFAEYGLGAARVARSKAESAFFAGDRAQYDWWLSLCRTLDRRLAAKTANGLATRDAPFAL